MLYLSGVSWSETFVVGFVYVDERSDLVNIRRRRFLMGMLTVVKVSFFSFTHAGLSPVIFLHARDVVKGVAIKFFIGESATFAKGPLQFRRRSIDGRAKYLCRVYTRKKL